MQLRYKCGHSQDVTIHKDGLEYINLRFVCNSCRRIPVLPSFVTIVVGVHTLVIKRARVVER